MLIQIGGVRVCASVHVCVCVVGWCSGFCKFILNSHLHALTGGQLRAPKNINAADVKNKSNTLGRRLYQEEIELGPAEVFSTFPPFGLIYFGV